MRIANENDERNIRVYINILSLTFILIHDQDQKYPYFVGTKKKIVACNYNILECQYPQE